MSPPSPEEYCHAFLEFSAWRKGTARMNMLEKKIMAF